MPAVRIGEEDAAVTMPDDSQAHPAPAPAAPHHPHEPSVQPPYGSPPPPMGSPPPTPAPPPPGSWQGAGAQGPQFPPPYAAPAYGTGYQFPPAPAPQYPAYGYPPPAPPPWGDPRFYGGYGPPVPVQRTNPLAIASLVSSLAGIVPFWGFIGIVLGIVFGFVARSQIRRTGGAQEGSGLALAGIIIGFTLATVWILLVVILVVVAHNQPTG